MNKTVIVVIVIVAAIVVGVPLVGKMMNASKSGAPAADGGSGEAAPADLKAPALDATTLTNSVWSMKVDKVTLTVTFQPGGVLLATSPLLKALTGSDSVTGTWTVSGADLSITASAAGKTVSETAKISGDQILVKGQPAKRIQ